MDAQLGSLLQSGDGCRVSADAKAHEEFFRTLLADMVEPGRPFVERPAAAAAGKLCRRHAQFLIL
ncbi:hypothetical protein XH99_00190 [Bradyrhizobium nanningense]|uniref:Uncharacterized protein n=1 Tax=Bradyrhizobium nanningense TaxID=1325118 RepID=A0A4Q0SK80_9BRAD|nr:hypothetical protein XH99_00190 [Bradyrhizobium nanningense]